MKVQFKKCNPIAIIPSYAHKGDSGMDLFSVEEVFEINDKTSRGSGGFGSTGLLSEVV